ncbi:MAG: Ribosomal silencing factor RsfS [Planctomycetes bacterium]|nr:Ribosomal silencing factor RsfS [Planctomycetota bacterium]
MATTKKTVTKAAGAKKPAPGRKSARWTSRKLAAAIARLADEKQGERVVIMDVAQAIQVADYFVVAEGQNRKHLHVIAEHVARELKKEGIYRMGGSSMDDESWVLLDYGPVVLHAMSAKARAFYDLENLWGDCKRVPWRRSRKRAAAPEAVRPDIADDDADGDADTDDA